MLVDKYRLVFFFLIYLYQSYKKYARSCYTISPCFKISSFNLVSRLSDFDWVFLFKFTESGPLELMGFMDSQVLVALALSLLGGLSTSIGE